VDEGAGARVIEEFFSRVRPLYDDRCEAGRDLALALRRERGSPATVVVGLARGGAEVAAEFARVLDLPLDVVAVRKVAHSRWPEYGLGAVTPDGTAYIHAQKGLGDAELERTVERARREAAALDDRLHAEHERLTLSGKQVILIDDGIATGGTMVAAVRWARAAGARRVVAAVPVAADESLHVIRAEVDELVCPHPVSPFFAVAPWYASFVPVGEAEIRCLLAASREPATV
jgi:putative phosphoribosyl transferase